MISIPRVSVGTRNIEVPWYTLTSGSVTAITIANAANRRFDEYHFSPSMSHSLPSFHARHLNSPGSDPACGSVIE
jgi:hypothetical protein